MTDRDRSDHEGERDEEHGHEQPSARQLLHWATGDREAEAKALADAADGEVSEDDAELAVRRTHGDLGSKESPVDTDVARPEDVGTEREARTQR